MSVWCRTDGTVLWGNRDGYHIIRTGGTTVKTGYLATDQYGRTIRLHLGRSVRQQLLEREGAKRAAKMYIDTPTGSRHIGYVVRGRWFEISEIHEWNNKI